MMDLTLNVSVMMNITLLYWQSTNERYKNMGGVLLFTVDFLDPAHVLHGPLTGL